MMSGGQAMFLSGLRLTKLFAAIHLYLLNISDGGGGFVL